MTLSDAGDWAGIIAAGIAVLMLVGAAIGVVSGWWTARGPNQHALRDRLRKPLRELSLVCDDYYGRRNKSVNPETKYSFEPFDHLHEDGLISPSRRHIEQLRLSLRQIDAVLHPTRDQFTTWPTEEDRARVDRAFEHLDKSTKRYLKALGKMDNAGVVGYYTYLRYRFIPPILRHPMAEPQRDTTRPLSEPE